jgi:hypothetical protein
LPNAHVEESDIERYSLRALPEGAAMRIERHLLICEFCRQRLVEAEEYMHAIKQAAIELSRPRRIGAPRWSFPRLLPAFAALAVLVVAALRPPTFRRGKPAPFTVSLRTMRGPANQTNAPSGRPLLLRIDLTALAPAPVYHLEMVNQTGGRVWQGALRGDGSATADIPAQNQGTYFVRIALPSGETLREYVLEIR